MKKINLFLRGFRLSKWDKRMLVEAYRKYQKLKRSGFPSNDARIMSNLREDKQFETAFFLHRNNRLSLF